MSLFDFFKRRASNPVPPSSKSLQQSLDDGSDLYERFSGHTARLIATFKDYPGVKGHKALVAFGVLDGLQFAGMELDISAVTKNVMLCATTSGDRLYIVGDTFKVYRKILSSGYLNRLQNKPVHAILYTTVRDGATEHYIHDFAVKSRPLFSFIFDGTQIVLRGGAYDFTERGIVDRRK